MNETSKQCFALMFPFSICGGGEGGTPSIPHQNCSYKYAETPLEDRQSGVQTGRAEEAGTAQALLPQCLPGGQPGGG